MEKKKELMLNIVVDDGSRRVPITNKSGEEIGAFTFHPTDLGIIERYNEMAAGFDEILAPLRDLQVAEDEELDLTDPKYAKALNAATERMLAAVDKLLGSEGAGAVFFGRMNPFSPVEGDFYCTRVLNALGAYIGGVFEAETAKFSAKAQKYMKKAARK